jgi:hypothetical protein
LSQRPPGATFVGREAQRSPALVEAAFLDAIAARCCDSAAKLTALVAF